MKVTWLGKSGLLFDNGKIKVLVDPVLDGEGCPITPQDITPEVVVLTHSHRNHISEQTLKGILGCGRGVTVLCSEGAYTKIEPLCNGDNPVLLSPHSVYSVAGVTFYSVKAEHTDRTAIGVIIDDGDKTYYVSGDTLYNFDVIDDVLDLAPDGVDYAFLPINGTRDNMNAKDAADFAYEISAGRAIPVHFDEDDNVDPAEFDFEDALVLTPFVEKTLD